MANPSITADEKPGYIDRFRRELRNPSMMTVFLIIVAVSAIPLALLVPSWVNTTRQSFQDRNAADSLRDAQILSSSVLVPSQIVPWMLDQIERMETADSPADWHYTSYVAGPCDSHNLSQLPAGRFADSIADTCRGLLEIQLDHGDECTAIQTCRFSPEAGTRLAAVKQSLLDVFADADFVLPYIQEEEQPTGP